MKNFKNEKQIKEYMEKNDIPDMYADLVDGYSFSDWTFQEAGIKGDGDFTARYVFKFSLLNGKLEVSPYAVFVESDFLLSELYRQEKIDEETAFPEDTAILLKEGECIGEGAVIYFPNDIPDMRDWRETPINVGEKSWRKK